MSDDFVLRSRRVVLPEGERAASVCVAGGQIAAIEPYDRAGGEDLGDIALLPGLVDTHVHINEPGRTEWEGFASATAAAAAGGVTTLIDMPLNSIPATTTVAALAEKRTSAAGQCHVDVGFWGGAVPQNLNELPALASAGVFGFKVFLAPSGVPEFDPLTVAEFRAALAAVDAQFIVHAEDPARLTVPPTSREYRDFLASRPPSAETAAIVDVIEAARSTESRVHILHLSSADAVADIVAARAGGVAITAETCPHYLTLAAEAIPAGATQFKCCPPIRSLHNQARLWAALSSGAIDIVVSDHSPSPLALKRLDSGDFGEAWGGISSIQLGLPVIWTGARDRGFSLADVVRWMATRPADLMRVPGKGRIAVGADADLVAFDPAATWVVQPERLLHRHPITPYAGREVAGAVKSVWLRGVSVDGTPRGRLLTPVGS